MSNEPEIGKEMSEEEKMVGISDTSQNNVQIEQIAKESSEIININNEPSNLTVTTNITDRIQIQETILENENRLKAIIQGLSIAAFVVDSDHRVLYWNKALEVLSNIRAEEIIGTTNQWKAFYTQKRPCMADILIDGGLDDVEKWYAGRYKKSSLLDDSFEATDFFPNLGNDGKWLRFTASVIRNTSGDLVGVLETLEDISERKKAEETLRESEERYRILFNEALDGICLADAETGLIIDCNQALADLVDRELAELIGQSQTILHPPYNDPAPFSPTFRQHLTIEEGQTLETQVVTRTGIIREVEIKANQLNLQGRKMLNGIFHDMTERNKAEDALRRSEEKYRMVTENASDVIWTMDLNLRFTYVTPSNEKLTGYTTEKFLKLSLGELLTPESIERALQSFTAEMQLENSEEKDLSRSVTLQLNEIRADGTIFPMEVRMCLLRDTHANPIGILGITRDITERKKTEEALKKSEEKFFKAFKCSPVAIAITHMSDGKFVEINESLVKLFGYSHAELLAGSSIGLGLWMDNDDRKHVVEELNKNGYLYDHEYRFCTNDCKVIVARYSAEIIDFSGERCILSVLIDLTEKKRAEESLRESEEKYRSIVENTQDVIMLTNSDSRISYLSPACVSVLEYTPDDLVGKILEIFYPEDIEKVHTALSSALQGSCRSNLEYRILTKNGKIRWVAHSWSPIFTENHELKCIVSVVRDINESKIAEQTLKEKIEELEKYKNVTVNREVKMVDLKNEINELCKQLNQKPKYPNI